MQDGDVKDSLNRILEAQNIQSREIAAMQATLKQWDSSIERFWEHHWPDLKSEILDLRDEVHDLREALSGMRANVEVVKVQSSHWTGIAALLGTIILMIQQFFQKLSGQ